MTFPQSNIVSLYIGRPRRPWIELTKLSEEKKVAMTKLWQQVLDFAPYNSIVTAISSWNGQVQT